MNGAVNCLNRSVVIGGTVLCGGASKGEIGRSTEMLKGEEGIPLRYNDTFWWFCKVGFRTR